MTPDPDWIDLEKRMDADVAAACKAAGRLHYHTRDSRKSQPGFPDWVIVLDDVTLFAEMKRGKKERLKKDQVKWLTSIKSITWNMDVFVIKGRGMLQSFVDVILFGNVKNVFTKELFDESLYHLEKDYHYWIKKDLDMKSPEFEKYLSMNRKRVVK